MRAELIAVGDELLYGDIVNGNAAWLGQQLADAGVRLSRSIVVGDDIDVIAEAIRVALDRADAVILTGGLGPTQDDLTREALAAAAGVELRRDDFLEAQLRRRFQRLNRNVPDRNFRQADLPEGADQFPLGVEHLHPGAEDVAPPADREHQRVVRLLARLCPGLVRSANENGSTRCCILFGKQMHRPCCVITLPRNWFAGSSSRIPNLRSS